MNAAISPSSDRPAIAHWLARISAISVALALFFVGSNYCVIGAVRGTPMACTSIGNAGAENGESAAPICPLHTAKRSHGSKSPARGNPSCCVTIARADAPELPRVDATPMPITVLAVIAASLDVETPVSVAHHHPLDSESPPTAWEKCAHAGRAPPSLA